MKKIAEFVKSILSDKPRKSADKGFLENSWEEREVKSYKVIFGDTGPGIYPLSTEVFNRMKASSIDPRWLTYGVFKCPPTEERKTWAYVTSGMSNPWDSESPEEYSGMGSEFVMETDEGSDWPVEVLQTLMAYNILLASGKMGDLPILNYGQRLPLALSDSIKTMMFTEPLNFPANFSIQSGMVDLIQVIGITSEELDLAKETSSNALKCKIVEVTGGLVTKKDRASTI